MTPQTPACSPTAASCDLREDGAPEVEITPEMIDAGVSAYLDFDLRFGDIEDRVSAVYCAMVAKKISLAIAGG